MVTGSWLVSVFVIILHLGHITATSDLAFVLSISSFSLVFENSFQSTEQNGNRETQLYEEKLAELEKDINSKNQRIKRLEEILSSKRGRQTMRQVSRERENLSNMMSLPWLAVSECEAGERSQQPGSVPLCRVRGGEAV